MTKKKLTQKTKLTKLEKFEEMIGAMPVEEFLVYSRDMLRWQMIDSLEWAAIDGASKSDLWALWAQLLAVDPEGAFIFYQLHDEEPILSREQWDKAVEGVKKAGKLDSVIICQKSFKRMHSYFLQNRSGQSVESIEDTFARGRATVLLEMCFKKGSRHRRAIQGAIWRELFGTFVRDILQTDPQELFSDCIAYLAKPEVAARFTQEGSAKLTTRLAGLAKRNTRNAICKARNRHRIISECPSLVGSKGCETVSDAELAEIRAIEHGKDNDL